MSLGANGLCSVSPAHFVGSSFTCAEPIGTQVHSRAGLQMGLWIARHAKPLIEPGICYGALDVAADVVLTRAAAEALVLALPGHIAVRVSPLKRCVQLAESLQALRPELVFTLDARLREMDFGTWEGVPWADIPKEAVDAWTENFAHHRFGGKESANEVLTRVASAWDELQGTPTLWIAHAGVAQASALLQQGLRHIAHAKDWPVSQLKYGQWLVLEQNHF